jgi:hypothetical protein
MDVELDGFVKFSLRSGPLSFCEEERSWRNGRAPSGWKRLIVVLDGGFSRPAVTRDTGPVVADRVRSLVRDRLGMDRPVSCPRVRILAGDLAVWRRGFGHFLLYPCNGCGRPTPSYWLETPEDLDRATEIEHSHPAIPFMDRGLVLFEGGHFLGCYCDFCLGAEERVAKEGGRESA